MKKNKGMKRYLGYVAVLCAFIFSWSSAAAGTNRIIIFHDDASPSKVDKFINSRPMVCFP